MTSLLTFTPGNHSYWLRNEVTGKKSRIPSVTTLLNQLAKPQLVTWAARTAADYAVDHWDALAAQPPSKRAELIRSAPDQAKSTAAASGTQIHAWAEQLLNGQEALVADEYTAQVQALADFWARSGFATLRTETMVWSDEDDFGGTEYAGTFDILAERNGQTWLLDIKTGKGVYPEHGVQLAGYATAETIVIDGEDRPMPRIDKLGVLHVRPEATTLHTLDPSQGAWARDRWQLLRGLRNLAQPTFQQEAS